MLIRLKRPNKEICDFYASFIISLGRISTKWTKRPLCTLFGYQGSVATFLFPKCFLFQNRYIPQNPYLSPFITLIPLFLNPNCRLLSLTQSLGQSFCHDRSVLFLYMKINGVIWGAKIHFISRETATPPTSYTRIKTIKFENCIIFDSKYSGVSYRTCGVVDGSTISVIYRWTMK